MHQGIIEAPEENMSAYSLWQKNPERTENARKIQKVAKRAENKIFQA